MMQDIQFTADDLRRHRARLPRSVNEMLDFIGAEATAALLNSYGGKALPVSRGINRKGRATNARIVALIGQRAADRFAAMYGRTSRLVQIPSCNALRRHIRNQRIAAEFDAMCTGENALTANQAIDRLAESYGICHRSVYRLLKQG